MLVAVAVLTLTLGAAGCGSKKSSAPATTTSTSTSSSRASSATATAHAFTSVKNCQKLRQLGVQLSQAITANGGSRTSQGLAKAYADFANHAPAEIRGDLKTLAGAFKTYLDALTKAGYKPGSTPTAAQLAALAQAANSFTMPKMAAAEQHLTAWVKKSCGSG